ncbi:GNAT family N-acetyltransferase [Roseibium salinum]|uniref:GNAT family N-acetyltransferase n=1 Tax=Roseibium salinum TaxID=1604349 RepID=A0ABT3QZ41_9HYPH|nr:GNAT family N-acetyltransferase [Roseibium sp. DSM 29163]MCX2722220.1 GNAT family N-acetyltransferase [Roseibium sp. DSM 29163]MDN3719766.1 GNAT family N-acetyltransferase [Roseibium salinum]
MISPVDTSEDLETVKTLFRAYVDWLGIDLSYQGFEEELAGMPGKYAPPSGGLYLAKDPDGAHLGCVGLRALGPDGACEMKRLYVLPAGRGRGVGGALVDRVLEAARRAGYREMFLDTLPSMAGAIKLYQAAGFEVTTAYYDTPIRETLFFRKVL